MTLEPLELRLTTQAGYRDVNRRTKKLLLLDLTQFALDLIGIVEPTPFADSASAAISFSRGDLLGGAMSAAGIIPYIGDLAKLGKISRHVKSTKEAIKLARKDSEFAKFIKPLLERLRALLDDLPIGVFPKRIRHLIEEVRTLLVGVVKPIIRLEGPITKALKALRQKKLQKAFIDSFDLPIIRNPRKLKKRRSAVHINDLTDELRKKGFRRVKKGTHPKAKRSRKADIDAEDSDIWLRRIRENGRDRFEAVRVDLSAGRRSQKIVDPKDRTGIARKHHTLTTKSKNDIAREMKELDGHLSAGRDKKQFSHWHHEKFDATAAKLRNYLDPKKQGKAKVDKFDSMGRKIDKPLKPPKKQPGKGKLTEGQKAAHRKAIRQRTQPN